MRAHEIIQNYIDPNKIRRDMYDEIVDALERAGAIPRTAEFLQLMYGDPRERLELEQLELDLKRTQAEVGNLEAEAARDRAATRRELAAVEDDEMEDSRPDSVAKRKRLPESWLPISKQAIQGSNILSDNGDVQDMNDDTRVRRAHASLIRS